MSSGSHKSRRGPWRLLLAHDSRAASCDGLFATIETALGDVEISDVASIEAARAALHAAPLDVCLVCLDLPPAPLAGVRLAAEIFAAGPPLVLVTRPPRLLPPAAVDLRPGPWNPPHPPAGALSDAIVAALEPGRAGTQGIRATGDDWRPLLAGRGR